MSALVFLGVAVAISVIGSIVIAIRQRPKSGFGHSINDFSDHLRALAPEPDDEERGSGT